MRRGLCCAVLLAGCSSDGGDTSAAAPASEAPGGAGGAVIGGAAGVAGTPGGSGGSGGAGGASGKGGLAGGVAHGGSSHAGSGGAGAAGAPVGGYGGGQSTGGASGGATGGVGGTTNGGAGGAGDDGCSHLTPGASPTANRSAIESCLTKHGYAKLDPGVFPVDHGIIVDQGQELLGNGPGSPTILMAGGGTNFLVTARSKSHVGSLILDGNSKVSPQNGAIVHVSGQGALIDNCFIGNKSPIPDGYRITGVYFLSPDDDQNVVQACDIGNNFYGVIFGAADAQHVNSLVGGQVHESLCDGVTFVGFGKLSGVKVSENGYHCQNQGGDIPGASVYSLNNDKGAIIDGCELSDDCGNVVDIDGLGSFQITNNKIHGPGFQWAGAHPLCGGGAAVALLDVHDMTITGNEITNDGRPQNRVGGGGDPNGVFSPSKSDPFGDLPAGGNTTIAFWLGRRPGASKPTTNNHVDGNAMRSGCTAGCSGLGYFTSRGTGEDAGGGWSASTTNYFTKNDPFGSQTGSKRCGRNWFAGNSTCSATQTDPPCNSDDSQHSQGSFHNDSCAEYP